VAIDIAPMPYGTMYPNLTGSYNYNTQHTPADWIILCPNCGSDNVCCLDIKHNPDIETSGLWYCISCRDSWRYEQEW